MKRRISGTVAARIKCFAIGLAITVATASISTAQLVAIGAGGFGNSLLFIPAFSVGGGLAALGNCLKPDVASS